MGSKSTPYSLLVQKILNQYGGREVSPLSEEERTWRLQILKAQWAAVDAVDRQKFDRSHIHKEG